MKLTKKSLNDNVWKWNLRFSNKIWMNGFIWEKKESCENEPISHAVTERENEIKNPFKKKQNCLLIILLFIKSIRQINAWFFHLNGATILLFIIIIIIIIEYRIIYQKKRWSSSAYNVVIHDKIIQKII